MINQVRFSDSVKFFEQGFCDRWNIKKYHDINAPAFFAGVYSMNKEGQYTLKDVDIINKHKGFKVIWNTGAVDDCFDLIDPNNVVVKVGGGIIFSNPKYRTKQVSFEIKDFSMFKPTPLGNNIYWYMGIPALNYMYFYSLYEEIKDRCKYNIILGYQGHNIEWIKKNYYDKSFVNIKPCICEGFTSSTEMAFMGRRTIGGTSAPWIKNFDTADELLKLIDIEAKKIGTMPKSLVGDFFTKEDWRKVNFWT